MPKSQFVTHTQSNPIVFIIDSFTNTFHFFRFHSIRCNCHLSNLVCLEKKNFKDPIDKKNIFATIFTAISMLFVGFLQI